MTTYRDRLHQWCIICSPKSQPITVARFRNRNNADDHLKVLQNINPSKAYAIVFSREEESV